MTTLNQAVLSRDLDEILRLLRENNLLETGVREGIDGFSIVRDDEGLVACCGLEIHGADGLLRSLAVRSSHRGTGLGASLVRVMTERAERARLSALYLLTTTATDYFPRFGFVTCARAEAPEGIRESWEFRTGCPDTATLMRRALGVSRRE